MNKTEYLLTVLAEECVETAQRATKAIRFKLDEIQEGQHLNNAQRLVYEFNDIVAVMEELKEHGLIGQLYDREMIEEKKTKMKKYFAYSESLGTLHQ